MALENIYCDAFIRARLVGDSAFTTALGGQKVYRGRAPQGTAYPLCIFRLIDADDSNSANQQSRLIVRATYELAIVSKGFPGSSARTAAHRMDELFRAVRRQQFTIDGVTLYFNTWRTQLRPTTEPGAGADEFFISDAGLYVVESFTE